MSTLFMKHQWIADFLYRHPRTAQSRLPTATILQDLRVARIALIGKTSARRFATTAVQAITTDRLPFPASCPHPCRDSTWQRSLLRVAPWILLIQHQHRHPPLSQWRPTTLRRLLCLRLRGLRLPNRACLRLMDQLTLVVAMVVRLARQGCVVLPTGKLL